MLYRLCGARGEEGCEAGAGESRRVTEVGRVTKGKGWVRTKESDLGMV